MNMLSVSHCLLLFFAINVVILIFVFIIYYFADMMVELVLGVVTDLEGNGTCQRLMKMKTRHGRHQFRNGTALIKNMVFHYNYPTTHIICINFFSGTKINKASPKLKFPIVIEAKRASRRFRRY
jgi:hypothetical protein